MLVKEPKKSGFHTVRKHHIKKNDVRKQNGYRTIFCIGEHTIASVQWHQQKAKHPRQYGG